MEIESNGKSCVKKRYFCPSCQMFVEESRARHDRMTHIPIRRGKYLKRVANVPASYSSVTHLEPRSDRIACHKSSEKKFGTKTGLELPTKLTNEFKNKANIEPQSDLQTEGTYYCYFCKVPVKPVDYIDHIINDDIVRVERMALKTPDTNKVIGKPMTEK